MKPIGIRLLLTPLAVLGGGLSILCRSAAVPSKHIAIAEVPIMPRTGQFLL